MSLVVVVALAGWSQSPGAPQTGAAGEFLALVQPVRGVGDAPSSFSPSSLQAADLTDEQALLLDRSSRVSVPDADAPTGPMPTPVAVDPNATPLPAPQANVGQTQTSVSSRVATPAPPTGALVWPVPAGSISQYYHAGHLALDIAAPYGSTVVAVQGGTVTWAAWRNNGGGYVVEIDHGNGMRTVYNHLGSIWVAPGQYVGAGQGIAGIGCTGLCTGPHTHFEVIVNGVLDNPLRYY